MGDEWDGRERRNHAQTAEGWDGRERRKPRWAIDNWSSLQGATSLLLLCLAGIVGGVKLISRLDVLSEHLDRVEQKVSSIEAQTSRGILPVTQVRIESVEERLRSLATRLEDCLSDLGRRKGRGGE